jgi:hypothetical protein
MASSIRHTCTAADIIDVEDMVNPASFGGTIQYVSANGMAVTGKIGTTGFRWTSALGVETFTDPAKISGPDIRGITDDGTKVYVQSTGANSGGSAGYWTSGLSRVVLTNRQTGVNSEYVRGVSGNSWFGSVFLSTSGNERASVNGSNMGMIPGAQTGTSTAYGRGGVGDSNIADGSPVRHASWGSTDLGVLPGGTNSIAYSSNLGDDSTGPAVIVGYSGSSNGGSGFRWTVSTGMQAIAGFIPTLVSSDGYWIFGGGFIWDSVNGARDLRQVLVSSGVAGIENWSSVGSVDTVYGNSVSGYTLTGVGSNGRYIVRNLFAVPEPSSVALATIACGATIFIACRRKNRRV